MAERIPTDAVGRILEVLGSQAFREIQLACGVGDEIRKLQDTVETINGVLLDAEEQFNQKNKSHAVTVLLRRLQDVVYDADDLLDDFCTQLKLKEVMSGNKMSKEVRIFFSKSNQIAYNLKMGHKIKAIRERLDDIKNDQFFLNFKHDNGKEVNYYYREREQTYSFVPEENVIGRDDDKKAILQLLLDSNDHAENNIHVISIVGIGGIGKTTIAQSIYNVEKVKIHFQLRMWVCVSDDFTLKTVVEKILKSATEKEIGKLEMNGLQRKLREQIDGKKYLLVLDDVWNKNPNKWSELKDLLRNGSRGSKILITTREEQVANIMSMPPLIHVLRGLAEDKSWSLFTKIAFEQGKEPKDSSFLEIGKDIVAKCVGVPLAIRTIGNLLCRKDKKEDWLSFRDNKLSELDQHGDILPILKLSYDYLSSPLKECFAYCALFPKDYEFDRDNLVQLWMAQGFLGTPKKNQCLEDVGYEYFMDLLSGSFLQDLREEEFTFKRSTKCKMHDILHDVAQSVVGDECKMVTSDAVNVDERSRHISFDPKSESLNLSNAILRANRLRTFFPLCSDVEVNNFHFNKIISNFRYLRSLRLSGLNITKVPSSIEKLKLLRYLNLSNNRDVEQLPNSMSKLINLQTLDLSYCSKLKKLPKEMRKMVSLQYLMIDDCESLTSMPCGLGQLTSLRTLSLFVVGEKDRTNDALRELHGLNKLRGGLTINRLGTQENFNLSEANLQEKQYLKSIRLIGDGVMVEGLKPHPNLKELSISHLGSVMFSGCMSSFTNLNKIEISDSSNFRNISPLDQLPSLLSLNLSFLDSLEYLSESDSVSNCISTSTTTFFPSLKELTIYFCEKLRGWWKINDDADDQVQQTEKAQLLSFPCLSKMDIFHCPMLTCMPSYPTLEVLHLGRTSSKPLQQTMMMKVKSSADADSEAPSTSYSIFDSAPTALSNLKSLVLIDINDYDQLDLLDETDADDKQCPWQRLRSLRCLKFSWIKNMVFLPKWIHHFTTLQHLEIGDCKHLLALPEGMQLEKLEIFRCPHLLERYGNNKGVEWPKIAHIPNISIDFRWIQLEGCYQAKTRHKRR